MDKSYLLAALDATDPALGNFTLTYDIATVIHADVGIVTDVTYTVELAQYVSVDTTGLFTFTVPFEIICYFKEDEYNPT